MSFVRGFNRDFAQAVNDLVPDPEEEKKETVVTLDIAELDSEKENGSLSDNNEEIRSNTKDEKKTKSRRMNVKAAVSEAIERVSSNKPEADKDEMAVKLTEKENELPSEANGEAFGSEEVVKTDKEEGSKIAMEELKQNSDKVEQEAVKNDIKTDIETDCEEIVADSVIPIDDTTKDEISKISKHRESKESFSPVIERELKSSRVMAGNPSDNTAYITELTTINGDLETAGDIDITGRINGNVKCLGKMVVSGVIFGDIDTKSLYCEEAKIEGQVNVEEELVLGSGTVLVGNITSGSAIIAGAVNGDIDVHGPVIVDSTAVVIGNIKSKSVQINNGAVVEGFCSQCYSDIDAKSYFPKPGNK